tara:strand:- start:3131 stop:3523 length:393 start_codon:yes stop_codon:yes gene_type:complete
MSWLLASLAYILPTFPLGYFWHLRLFKQRYLSLEVYRERVIPPLGLAAMIVQGVLFGWVYVAAIAPLAGGWMLHAAVYVLVGGGISWSFAALASAAKNRMTSVRKFFAIETAFTLVQWVIVALITVVLVG